MYSRSVLRGSVALELIARVCTSIKFVSVTGVVLKMKTNVTLLKRK